MKAGTRVRCLPGEGSWCHNLEGTVIGRGSSSDGIDGFMIRVDGTNGYTVLPTDQFEVIAELPSGENNDQRHR